MWSSGMILALGEVRVTLELQSMREALGSIPSSPLFVFGMRNCIPWYGMYYENFFDKASYEITQCLLIFIPSIYIKLYTMPSQRKSYSLRDSMAPYRRPTVASDQNVCIHSSMFHL